METPFQADAQQDQIIAEEYNAWKVACPQMYEWLVTIPLANPSLTVQWLPNVDIAPGDVDYRIHRLLLGTNASEAPDFLFIANARTPSDTAVFDGTAYNSSTGSYGGYSWPSFKFGIEKSTRHDGEVHIARYMPKNPSILASLSTTGVVTVFDSSKFENCEYSTSECGPDIKLCGLEKEGFGLAWNKEFEGLIIGSSVDTNICLWDINQTTSESKTLRPLKVFSGHHDEVESVSWDQFCPNVFGSVSHDSRLMLWDMRSSDTRCPIASIQAHTSEVHCLDFNPMKENFILTGSSSCEIGLWDTRNLPKPVHIFQFHTEGITQVLWSPFSGTAFASASHDRRLNLWDLSRIGKDQKPEDRLEAPPELTFCHAGHTETIADFSWDPNQDWQIASVAQNNVLHIWQVDCNYYCYSDDDEGLDDPIDVE